jgi:cytochrome c553
VAFVVVGLVPLHALARPPIRRAFFDVYTTATGSRLDDLASNAGHCGLCHYDFDGGGPRNAYGARIEVAINSGQYPTTEAAIQSVENLDSDNDGYVSLVEITSALFTNTPTFPGLKAGDEALVSHVTVSEITPYLTPLGSADTTPPVVTVLSPTGGDVRGANTTTAVTWTASDASGVASVAIYHSDDGGLTFKPVSFAEPNDGTFDWFVPNRPGAQQIIRIIAKDNAGNYGADWSDGAFTITGVTGGVPTTLRDMDLPGTQPFGLVFEDADANCVTCHGNYRTAVEPWYQWRGSMMAQAMRDPLFLACLTVAEQDAPSVGDLCIRCHTPGGWAEGRSVDTSGGLVNAKDRQGVQCDFCHRLVDPDYQPGVSPADDVAVLDSLQALPYATANGQFVVDPDPVKRGPYADAQASHAFLASSFHRSAGLCGTCHDVSNPVFENDGAPGRYVPNAFDAPHSDGDLRNMFPVERTFSEWSMSDYANGGVYAPQFAGNKADGIVSTCQDCHMKDQSGKGCSEPGAPTRTDLPHHDLTGGNTFVPDIIPTFFPGEVDVAQLQAGKARATAMLQMAASMALAAGQSGPNPTVTVTVTNETAHKLPSGYPEGRRIWLNVKGYDESQTLVYESGAYDPATGELSHDADAKIYEIKIGVSERLSPIIGLPAAPSFHFVLNDTVYSDNRIPPRGFTNANFTSIQSPPVGHTYPDGQYWDETTYTMPTEVRFVEATLYYQTTSKEYIEFLRDENVTNSAGLDLYNAWVTQGRGAPVAMATDTISVDVIPTGTAGTPPARTELFPAFPNPFNPVTTIRFSLATRQRVRIDVFDVTGARVSTLVDEARPAGVQRVTWNGRDSREEPVASGVYMIRMTTAERTFVRKAVLLK